LWFKEWEGVQGGFWRGRRRAKPGQAGPGPHYSPTWRFATGLDERLVFGIGAGRPTVWVGSFIGNCLGIDLPVGRTLHAGAAGKKTVECRPTPAAANGSAGIVGGTATGLKLGRRPANG